MNRISKQMMELTPERRALLEALLQERGVEFSDPERISRRKSVGNAPLSYAQQRTWFIEQLEPGNWIYNVPTAIRLTGLLDIAALEQSFNEIIRRHEVLRTSFTLINGEPRQSIITNTTLNLAVIDLQQFEPTQREQQMRRLAGEDAQEPFDFSQAPLLRAQLLRLDEEEHVLLITMHHIVSDGWSMSVFFRELTTLYEAYAAGERSPLAELEIQYADYAVWQREWLDGAVLAEQLEYWKEQLSGAPAMLELPTDHPRPAVQGFRGGTQAVKLSASLSERLKLMSQQQGVTLFMSLLAAFKVLLWRYSAQSDIVIGTPIANRNRAEIEALIGFFVNTLVLRTELRAEESFAELVKRVREVCLGAYSHQDVPFEKVVEELQPERSLSHSPLFQVMFQLQNAPQHSLHLRGLKVERMRLAAETAKFDLTLTLLETEEGLKGSLSYNADLFTTETAQRMVDHFLVLLEAIVDDPQEKVSRLPLLGEAEREQVLVEWNQTARDYPSEQCIHQLFEQQAEQTPDAVAIVFEEEQLSYRELNERANQLAHYLQAQGVGPEVLVGLCMERSVEMIVALLGILKAGGAYVPLDPSYPQQRLSFMLDDASVFVLLSQSQLSESLPLSQAQVIYLDTDWQSISLLSILNPTSPVTSDNLAYVIYTSGSTGQPKGVAIAHRSAAAFLAWSASVFSPDDLSATLAATSICFDLSVFELFAPLACGARIILAVDALHLGLLPHREEVTLINTVPSAMSALLRERSVPESVRVVNLAGEALSEVLVKEVYGQSRVEKVYNLYGPSEDTTYSTYGLMSRGDEAVVIGHPISNTEVYILDERMEAVAVGVTGELYLGGAGLARGYLKRGELTAERFIPHPYSREGGARLYRTGDVGRYQRDGSIRYVGRLDHQVKIRGFRIELGEVEAVLRQHAEVREALVVAHQYAADDQRLVAYIVGEGEEGKASGSELRRWLEERLPGYMIPAAIMQLERMPLTANGKVDRQALPQPFEDRSELEAGYVAPQTPVQEMVASIWSQVLKVEQLGVHDNFFDLGGHSLLATQVISRLRQAFRIEMPLRSIFASPTIDGLARIIESASRDSLMEPASEIKAVSREGALALSYAQERLWLIDQLEPGNSAYNIPSAIRLRGQLNIPALEESLNEMMRRHEVLRTSFVLVDERPVQLIAPSLTIELPVTDLSSFSESERQATATQLIRQEAQLPFDLAQGPLLRASLLHLEEQEHVLLLTMHHIISDGWSMSIFFRELTTLYEAYAAGERSPLAELEIQYADYAVWQREWLDGAVLAEQLEYWKEQLSGAPAMLELPTDHPRPAVQSHRGASQQFIIDDRVATSLKELSRRSDVTLFMSLLAAFKVLLWRYSAQSDIIIGTPIANRNRAEIEALIGFFVNTLVLRTEVRAEESFEQLVKRVREVCLGAYSHQDVPFEKVVEELQPERSLSHSPLFQVMFQLQNVKEKLLELSGLSAEPLRVNSETVKYDLMLAMAETKQGLTGVLMYNRDLFTTETAQRMVDHFLVLLEAIVDDPQEKVSRLPLLSTAEREQVLIEWNQTAREYPSEQCIHQLFEQQVVLTPDAVAIVFEEEQLSYRELNERANQLAHYLQSVSVGPEVLVGVCMERSVEMVVSILAILKAGGAYVPLDPSYPQQRLAFMLDDASVFVLLSQSQLSESLPLSQAQVIYLDTDWQSISLLSILNPTSPVTSDNLAYVIYTSGSTGQPKGVAIAHRSAAAFLAWAASVFSPDDLSATLAATSICFDLSVFELFAPLACGARIILAVDALDLGSLPHREEVTLINTVPSAMSALLRERSVPESVRVVNLAGEALSEALVKEVYGQSRVEKVYNLYGPSEDTTYSTYGLMSRGDEAVVIGRPVSNTEMYILDERMEAVAVGVTGELYLGGAGLARGYLKRGELTAERFIPHPYSREGGARLYRTGDVGRYQRDGSIRYVGRLDHQVKIRGFRIELGEIEAAVREYAGVREALAVVSAEAERERRVVCYVVMEGGQEMVSGEVRGHLREKLPEYMIPAAIMQLERMPLTANGKVDRQALPQPFEDRSELEAGYVAPQTPVQEMVASIWSQVLKVEQLGVHDNFFDLGGHSLLATQVISRLRQAFRIEMPLRSIFASPTIDGLARIIESASRDSLMEPASEIKAVSREGALALSYAQERLWLIDQLEPGNSAYNIPSAIRLRGQLNIPALEESLNEMVRRHEVLRTTFVLAESRLVQVISGEQRVELRVRDLRQVEEREAEALAIARAEGEEGFELAAGPLLRARLLQLGDEEHVLLLTMHHIISDGWSMSVFFRELTTLYEAYAAGERSPLAELEIQYADYAVWQREWLDGAVLAEQLEYWKEQLSGAPAMLELPTDHPRPAVQSHRGAVTTFDLPESLTTALKQLSRRSDVTLFMSLLAAFKVLLWRYSAQSDIVIGTPIANRNRAEIEALIGFFVNTLVLRTELRAEESFAELVKRVREVCLGAYSHQDVPFEKVVEELQPERSLSHSPLFQVTFVLQNMQEILLELSGLSAERLRVNSETVKYDLMLAMAETGQGLTGVLMYNRDLFTTETAQRMVDHFLVLLEAIVDDPQEKVSRLPLLGEAERQQVLVEWNQTAREYPSEQCIHQLFEQQAEQTPEALAIVFEEEQVSYRELNERANQLAHYLQAQGVGPEVLVGICMERSVEMVVSILAVLKAGGAYVPLDPSYPQQRLSFMLDDADVKVLLIQEHLRDTLPANGATVLCLDSGGLKVLAAQSRENAPSRVNAQNLAYVIYTSGSTGRPKGVMVGHGGVCNLARAQGRAFNVEGGSRVLQFASFSFDASVWEIFMALVPGATLYLGRSDSLLGQSLITMLREQAITTVTLSPSVLESLPVEELPALETIIVAGEACSADIVERWSRGRRFINAYGPTETTVCATMTEDLDGSRRMSIGRPIANMQVYLLDQHLEPVPVGAQGELHVGGAGLARGYLNQPELTATKFIPNSFGSEPGAKLYKTGDLARYLPDGSIEFLGRIDAQVKVRGHRIEVGEVETVLDQHPGVRKSCVMVREDSPGEKRLVGYVATDQSGMINDLRRYMKEKLPEYMIPTSLVLLSQLPLTPNGKVDHRALPAPDDTRPELEDVYIAPRTPVEEMVASIWSQVLKVEQIGVHDNFFDLGGHSLLATQVISRIRQAFRIEMPLRSIFASPTIDGLARIIESTSRDALSEPASEIKAVSREGALALSYAQERLWLIDQLEPGNSAYNIPSAIRLRGQMNIPALAESLNEMVRRHEVLRTTFVLAESRLVQVISGEQRVELRVRDLRQVEEREAEALAIARAEGEEGFELAAGPLLRARLLQLGDEEHVLLLTMHHIVSDGWSMGLFFRELKELYGCFSSGERSPLAELEIQYADYAVWQREWLDGAVLTKQLEYWKEQLSGAPAMLELPTDHPRPAVQSHRGASQQFIVDDRVATSLKELSRRSDVTLFMSLLAAFEVLLWRYSAQSDIVIGTPIANRNRAEIEALIGFFVNTLVLRTEVRAEESFEQLVKRVREVCLGAYSHQDVPFEKVVEELQPERSLSHSPLFQVMFQLQNVKEKLLELSGLSAEPLRVNSETVKYDLMLAMTDTRQGLMGSLLYNRDLFTTETAQRMVDHFLVLLEAIVDDPQQQVSRLPLLGEAEREQVLVEWNQTRREYPSEQCIHQLFEQQAEQTPEALAIVFEEEQVSYRELNERANQLAHYLQAQGVGPEVLVGLCMQRSVEMVVGVLAVLKAGGAYVPLDPAYPQQRLKLMIEDAGVGILLTQEQLVNGLPEHSAQVLCLDSTQQIIAQEERGNPFSGVAPGNLAYMIYTSGSTGIPKGVQIKHGGVCNIIAASIEGFEVRSDSRVLQLASLSFDASVLETFTALLSGARLYLVSRETLASGSELARMLEVNGINIMALPPSLLDALPVADYPELRTIIVGGEACSAETVARWSPGRRFFNAYAPTETTIYSTLLECSGTYSQGPPMGRPVANTEVYVLDQYQQPVPAGAHGELHIGGEGLARGYHHYADLTAERFIPNPFARQPGARLYRTGDLGRYLPDGNIEFVGRVDQQVKVRGFRIELGEIESALSQHPAVRETVLTAREDVAGDKRLVAYLVMEEGQAVATTGELRSYLKEMLPEYMVPTSFVTLEALPLTPNGKVDRRALPKPERGREESTAPAYVPPSTEVETMITQVWQEALKLEKIGMHDNFFDLGGHSLMVVQLHAKLQAIFNKEFSVTEIFKYPTVSSLSMRLSGTEDEGAAEARSRGREEARSLAQKRQKRLRQNGRKTRQRQEVQDV